MSLSFNRKRLKITLITVFLILAVLFTVCSIYVSDFYRADTEAIDAFLPEAVSTREKDGVIYFEPEGASAGLIFYPGGKVEYLAYIPLMRAIAQQGITCALVEMPFNLAVLDVNAADGIREEYPEIEHWYLGGHSLGGSMAASYLEKNIEFFDGLILLGSYSTADLSETDLSVLSVYGSEDRVMNKEKYEANKTNLPLDFKELVIQGGCHAYFGMYGAQDGDGIPTITNQEQIIKTAEAIADMITKKYFC